MFGGRVVRFAALSCVLWSLVGPALAQESRWEGAIRAFEERDREAPPPRHGVLFVGSSSIRMWDLTKHFPALRAINRGFGGSQVSDSVEFADRIILPYAPREIVLYAGDNDIAAGESPETVLADFRRLVAIVHERLPGTRILFVAIKPSLQRWGLVAKMRAANALVREETEKDPRLEFIDIDTPMIGADGRPRPELFAKDGLHLSDEGYRLWSRLVRERLRTPDEGQLRVATCQFPVSADIGANGRQVREQIETAASQGADLVHFPECALSGYAGVDHETLEGLDWDALRREMESVLDAARRSGVWVVLGSTHRLTGEHRPHNSLYVITPAGEVLDRYDKRFCTGGDLRHYSPGDHLTTFDVNGVRCGLLICYDIRFPELYRAYCKEGVRLVLHSFYNARQKQGSIHPHIMPPTAQARAATNGVFISVSNSSAQHSWQSLFVTPDGLIAERLALDEPGVMTHLVDTKLSYYDASRPFRLDAIEGKLHSGRTVDDPRSRDRTSY